jgi:hypothetical protein
MDELQAQRRLVKSPPELWAEISDEDVLRHHLAPFGAIRITRVEPENTVAWEGERASGTVCLDSAGWGTRVTLTAVPASPSWVDPRRWVPPEEEAWSVEPAPEPAPVAEPAPEPEPEPEPVAVVQPEPELEPEPASPRSVHAVPTNADLKVSRAVELFNVSEHPRTVSGVARSLGAPVVAIRPSATEGSVVTIVVAWELSWYRYEVDLGNEAAGVRVTEQGSELHELDPADQTANAAADEVGRLHLAA